ncbi:MAG: MFS transporter, partial [Bacteroidota bacterium]
MRLPKKLMNINYVLLIQGQFISRVGASLTAMVLLLWVKDATGSASLMGLMSMVSTIPAVLFGVIGGTWADRHERRKIIAYCDILAGVALLGLAVLFTHYPDNTALLAVGVVLASLFVAVMDTFS